MIIVLAALKEELGNEFEGVPVRITGVGKVRATLATAEVISEGLTSSDLIINFGTAGASHNLSIGECVLCDRFFEADMDPAFAEIGGIACETKIVPQFRRETCYTADEFQTLIHGNIRDMESYAIAYVCRQFKIPFLSFKYVSDQGNIDDWQANIGAGAKTFRRIYNQILLSF